VCVRERERESNTLSFYFIQFNICILFLSLMPNNYYNYFILHFKFKKDMMA